MRAVAIWTFAIVTAAAVSGCGSSDPAVPVTVPAPDTTAPLVLWTTPQADPLATVAATPTAIFSEAMKPETISSTTFTLSGPDGAVSGSVALSGDTRTATFTPDAPLVAGAQYTATISTGAQDAAGNGLAAKVSWTFRTQPAPDQTPPVVASVTPADGSTGNDGATTQVSAQFSEPLDCARVSSASLTVFELGVQVPGDVSCAAATLTFQPYRGLPTNTTLQAFVSPALVDRAGNPLGAGLQWTFQVKPWTRQIASTGDDEAWTGWMDSSGTRFVVGETRGPLSDDPAAGGFDAFVSKVSQDGTARWIHTFGSAASEIARGVATDAAGNVYVSGTTPGTLPGQTSAGQDDAFVVSFAADGTPRWTRQFGSPQDEFIGALAADAAGNVYVVGSTNGALPGQTLTGVIDGFVVKLDSGGNVVWTRQFGLASSDVDLADVAVSPDGTRIFVAGATTGSLGGNNAGGDDVFVRAFASDGGVAWTRQSGTASNDTASGIALDPAGSVLVSGMTGGTFTGQTSAGSTDVFVQKISPQGNVQWTRQLGTAGSDGTRRLAADLAGNIFLSTSSFLPPTLTKLDPSGAVEWSVPMTGQVAFPDSVAVDALGNLYATLTYPGGLDGLEGQGGYDIYVLKFDEDGRKR